MAARMSGADFHAHRTALGLTKPELGRQIGCSPTTIIDWERDAREVPNEIADVLAARVQAIERLPWPNDWKQSHANTRPSPRASTRTLNHGSV